MQSKINIAEGIKREHILEGEGQAASILQEARSLCESLESISKSIQLNDGKGGQALKLRLSEQYMETLSEVYRKTSVLMVPSGEEGNTGSTQEVAKILTMYKQIVGN